MLDFHTHILPQMDDGSKSVLESEEMINVLINDGVKYICLTPHFYSQNESAEKFLKRRENCYKELLKHNSFPDTNFLLGAEVYFKDSIFSVKDIKPLCINNTKFILTEFPYDEYITNKTLKRMEKFISKYNITPVLAHIERYPEVFNDKKLLDTFIELGCKNQMNLYSFDSDFLTKKLLRYLDEGYISFWGTDSHNMKRRSPIYKRHIELIKNELGDEFLINLTNTQIKLLTGKA